MLDLRWGRRRLIYPRSAPPLSRSLWVSGDFRPSPLPVVEFPFGFPVIEDGGSTFPFPSLPIRMFSRVQSPSHRPPGVPFHPPSAA